MASYAVHDFFSNRLHVPTWERLAVEPAPDTERSPGTAVSEIRIGVAEPQPSSELVRGAGQGPAEDTFWDDYWPEERDEPEPPTQRYGSDTSSEHVVLRPSEPTLLCAGVVRPGTVSAPAAIELDPEPPQSDVRPYQSEVRPRAPSVPESQHRMPDSLAMQVSERILGAVFRIGEAVERWLPA